MLDVMDLRSALDHNDNRARTIVFEDLVLPLRIGVYEAEKRAPQRVIVSAELLVLPENDAHEDCIDKVVDYAAIHESIVALAERPHIELQERLADEIAAICLAPAQVAAVRVHVRKPDAYADCCVGIRIVRTRPSRR